jgi:hypothetical protein
MSDTSLRARTTSEIVDAAFALYRRDFLQYTMVAALGYSPVLLLSLLSVGTSDVTMGLTALLSALVSVFSFALIAGLIARMGSDVYLGGRADVGTSVKRVIPRVLTLIGASFLSTFLIGLGFLLLVVPGLYMAARLFAVPLVIVLEQKGPIEALTRSGELTKGRMWHVFLTLLLVYTIFLVLSIGLSLGATSLGGELATRIVSSVFGIFAYPVLSLVSLVLYYDMRIRGEGFDVEHMSRSLGGDAPMVSSVA